MVPEEIAVDASIPDSALRVFLVLAKMAREAKSQQCGAIGIRKLARLANRSKTTVHKAVEELVARGYLERIHVERKDQPKGFLPRSEYTMTSKWFIPKHLRTKKAEQVMFEDETHKLVKKVKADRRGKAYKPTAYTLKENAG